MILPHPVADKTLIEGAIPMNKLSKTLFGALLSLAFVLPAQAETLMMATTTSTDNSGLLDFLAPTFQKETGIELKWVAVGTGKALEIAKNCNADVLLVHAPAVEKKFVADGYGIDRRQIMYNDFVIVGPKADPAKVAGKTTAEALKAIYDGKREFTAIAVVGGKEGTPDGTAFPCGVCRQVMAEFCKEDFRIITPEGSYTFGEILPHAFGGF